MKKKILVLIPAHNEIESVGDVIAGVRLNLPEADILVVDDGSSDGTREACLEKGAAVISLPFNLGVGAALQTGYKYSIRRGYNCLIQLDADGQHDPSCLPAFLEALKDSSCDMVIGSRFLERTNHRSPVTRRAGILFFAKILSFLIKQNLTDPTSGYRAMSDSVISVCSREPFSFDYPDAAFLLTLHMAGFRIREIPVEMKKRKSGKSQHSGLRPLYYVYEMLLSIFAVFLGRKPARY